MQELVSDYTIVIVTHNMQQAARVCDRTAFFTVDVHDDGSRHGYAGRVRPDRVDLHQPVRPADRGLRHGAVRMSRTSFHESLEQIEMNLLSMGELAGSVGPTAVEALVQHDDARPRRSSTTTTRSTSSTWRSTATSCDPRAPVAGRGGPPAGLGDHALQPPPGAGGRSGRQHREDLPAHRDESGSETMRPAARRDGHARGLDAPYRDGGVRAGATSTSRSSSRRWTTRWTG